MNITDESHSAFPFGDIWPSSDTGNSGAIYSFDPPPDNLQTNMETLFKEPWVEQKPGCDDELADLGIPDLLCDDLLRDILPPIFPGKLEATGQPTLDSISADLFLPPLEQNVEGDLTMDFLRVNGAVPNENDVIMQVPSPSRGKVGCKAMGYIGAAAVLETHGTPAPPRQTLDCDNTDGAKLYGSLASNTKLIVPQQVSSSNTVPPNTYGTITTDPKQTTVPDKVTCIIIPTTPCNTPSITLEQITVQDDTASIPDPNSEACGNPKKRRRRRRQKDGEDGESQKVRLYEIGPLDDIKEERKRRDAIRAKRCREKKINEVQELREKVMKMERELEGRQMYEEMLRVILRDKTGIVVMPYGTPTREQQMGEP